MDETGGIMASDMNLLEALGAATREDGVVIEELVRLLKRDSQLRGQADVLLHRELVDWELTGSAFPLKGRPIDDECEGELLHRRSVGGGVGGRDWLIVFNDQYGIWDGEGGITMLSLNKARAIAVLQMAREKPGKDKIRQGRADANNRAKVRSERTPHDSWLNRIGTRHRGE